MILNATVTIAPEVQKVERFHMIQEQHKAALERAVSLKIPHAVEEEQSSIGNEEYGVGEDAEPSDIETETRTWCLTCSRRSNWNVVVAKLLTKSESGELLLKKECYSTVTTLLFNLLVC
ncbi:hypothetical protein NMG60_11024133 [Bertholletia excelsa]